MLSASCAPPSRRPRDGRRGGLAARADRGAARRPARAHRAAARRRAPRAADLEPLTAKPVLFVANVDEGEDEPPPEIAAHAAAQSALAVAVCSRIDAELRELDDEEAAMMRADLGAPSRACSGRPRRLLAARPDLVLHRRRGQGPRVAGIERGLTAWGAAGKIHSDIQRGFVRAEVVGGTR